jgi:hypothetical protein
MIAFSFSPIDFFSILVPSLTFTSINFVPHFSTPLTLTAVRVGIPFWGINIGQADPPSRLDRVEVPACDLDYLGGFSLPSIGNF